MKNIFAYVAVIGACLCGGGAYAVSAGSTGTARGTYYSGTNKTTTTTVRGNAGLANAYRNNQLNSYYMVNQPDVDSACRTKIYNCLATYCGDPLVVSGHTESRCQYATETELYNYALMCLQKDTSTLLPQYDTAFRSSGLGMNTAARLCPSYVQQELMSYLSMANMSTQLSKSHSDLCIKRRQELEAAMSCHSVALVYGNETSSKLTSQLTDFCGAGVTGGSAEMVSRFANAGNVGANIWGWAEKIVSLDLNKKGDDWQSAVDAVLAEYTNRMNVACGDNVQLNTVSHNTSDSSAPTALQTAAALAVGVAFPGTEQSAENPNYAQGLYMEITSRSEIFDANTANTVVQAGLTNHALTQNNFFTTAQMTQMQNAYKLGTKVFVLRDSARCYIVPVQTLTSTETALMAQQFAGCVN